MAASLAGFSVLRREAELIKPAAPTPHELKTLSDLDDQDGFRFEIRLIHFFRSSAAAAGRDPVKVLRDAVAKALVFFYPFAGRLREGPVGKLIVDCNEEGIVFVEADANVTLDQFGDQMPPPLAVSGELIFEVEGSGGFLNCPLLLIQVTRLTCGGFVFGVRLNHAMSDGFGLFLFMRALADMAHGLPSPTTLPIWSRELLDARNPPQVHPEFEQLAQQLEATVTSTLQPVDMILKSFFFGPAYMAALGSQVPSHLRRCSTFELLTAFLWRSRTIALNFNPEEQVRIILQVNARSKCEPPLPAGYYGNAVGCGVAISLAGKLCTEPLSYALELLREAKARVNDEYMRSMVDRMVMKGRPHLNFDRLGVGAGSYLVSDAAHLGVDFGWGNAVYAGPMQAGFGPIPGFSSFLIKYRNRRGEVGTVALIRLPAKAMVMFEEIQKLIDGEVVPAHPLARL